MPKIETSGLLIVNKPYDYTSRDVVNIVTKKFQTKKIGHTGTLDPIATGVLVLTVNKATKLGEILTSETKEYIAEAILGYKTDTLDITGKIIATKPLIKDNIKEVVNSFQKKYLQEVPIYSAVKVNGRKLYEYARNNEEVILPKKEVEIKEIELLEVRHEEYPIIKFRCLVSKGTYIRSLINDIAESLETYGTMKSLIRTKQGNYKIENSVNLEDITEDKIIALDNILNDYFTVNLTEELEFKIKNGQRIKNIYNHEYVLFKSDNVLALYKDEKGILKPFKMFV